MSPPTARRFPTIGDAVRQGPSSESDETAGAHLRHEGHVLKQQSESHVKLSIASKSQDESYAIAFPRSRNPSLKSRSKNTVFALLQESLQSTVTLSTPLSFLYIWESSVPIDQA
ncbi:hypothetical protein PGTUg99_029689 [Puccinia graminis f. sp. tritici]|uniref:Uncharacterized protein n=1 Tax=Puccinia graminis f. sp. tritici TaxID=56615 RepID=A0A5B0RKL4_PUCGR|nr:hypothetical protein PGTUg99_029689 [Puccinia graminis f. sp. tritici]